MVYSWDSMWVSTNGDSQNGSFQGKCHQTGWFRGNPLWSSTNQQVFIFPMVIAASHWDHQQAGQHEPQQRAPIRQGLAYAELGGNRGAAQWYLLDPPEIEDSYYPRWDFKVAMDNEWNLHIDHHWLSFAIQLQVLSFQSGSSVAVAVQIWGSATKTRTTLRARD